MEVQQKTFKLCSFNVENPYGQVVRSHCEQSKCPGAKQFQPIKMCTHKLLEPNQLEDQKKTLWAKKIKQIFTLFQTSDLIALQEMEDSFVQELKKKCRNVEIYPQEGGYHYVCEKKPYSVLIWNSDKWNMVKSSMWERFPIVDLCSKVTQKTIRVAAVHLTGYDIEKNGNSIIGDKELEELVEEMRKDGLKGITGCLIMGDFNAPPESVRCKTLREKYAFQHLETDESRPDHTHTDIYTGNKKILDYIFFKDLQVSPRKKPLPEKISFEGENRVSDHIPVYGNLTLTKL